MASLISITGIPAPIDANYVATVQCGFEAQNTLGGTDWGPTTNYHRVYIKQNGVYTYGESLGVTSTRSAYLRQATFACAAGYTIECGLDAGVSGSPTTTAFWNLKLKVEIIKR